MRPLDAQSINPRQLIPSLQVGVVPQGGGDGGVAHDPLSHSG